MRSRKKKERNIRKIEKYEMRKKLKIYDIFGTPQRGGGSLKRQWGLLGGWVSSGPGQRWRKVEESELTQWCEKCVTEPSQVKQSVTG
jgi:hypothetical protein